MERKYVGRVLFILVALVVSVSSAALAQTPERRWSADIGIGFDNGISGNINSSGIGTLNNQTVVILKNTYENVYGTGLHLRFGHRLKLYFEDAAYYGYRGGIGRVHA